MKKELDYFFINGSIGWCQAWFYDWWMNKGSCAAVTACDFCACMARREDFAMLCPFHTMRPSKDDYFDFAMQMRPYLQPRRFGINTLEIYIEGISNYWRDVGCNNLKASGLYGSAAWNEARDLVIRQIDAGIIIPCLLLHHIDAKFQDFQWHWFNIAGYEEAADDLFIKVVTYGLFYWFSLKELWNTGHEEKGGLVEISVIYNEKN